MNPSFFTRPKPSYFSAFRSADSAAIWGKTKLTRLLLGRCLVKRYIFSKAAAMASRSFSVILLFVATVISLKTTLVLTFYPTLKSGQQLRQKELLRYGTTRLLMKKKCVVALYNGTTVIWNSTNPPYNGKMNLNCVLRLLSTGKLVIEINDVFVWSSGREGPEELYTGVLMQGQFSIRNAGREIFWRAIN